MLAFVLVAGVVSALADGENAPTQNLTSKAVENAEAQAGKVAGEAQVGGNATSAAAEVPSKASENVTAVETGAGVSKEAAGDVRPRARTTETEEAEKKEGETAKTGAKKADEDGDE